MNINNIRTKMNKKGESMLTDFWAILVFAIICIIILIIIIASRTDNTNKIQDEFASKDVNLMLNSFLRAPYAVWNGQTIAEIISEDSIARDYTRTQELFKKFFTGVDIYEDSRISWYALNIDGNNIETFYNEGYNSATVFESAETKIPGINGKDITVMITVYHDSNDKKFS